MAAVPILPVLAGITSAVGMILKIGGALSGALETAQAACLFFNTLNGSGWSTQAQKLWASVVAPLLQKVGVDTSKLVTSSETLWASYGRPLRALYLVVSTICVALAPDLTPTPEEQKELDEVKSELPAAPGYQTPGQLPPFPGNPTPTPTPSQANSAWVAWLLGGLATAGVVGAVAYGYSRRRRRRA